MGKKRDRVHFLRSVTRYTFSGHCLRPEKVYLVAFPGNWQKYFSWLVILIMLAAHLGWQPREGLPRPCQNAEASARVRKADRRASFWRLSEASNIASRRGGAWKPAGKVGPSSATPLLCFQAIYASIESNRINTARDNNAKTLNMLMHLMHFT